MRRSICALTLSLALLLAVPPVRALAAEGDFSPVRAYEEQFADVSPRDWFYTPVKALYELGLTNGQGRADRFDPDGALTVAEAVTMAARLRSLYETGETETGPAAHSGNSGTWYQPYADYLQEIGSLGDELDSAYDRPATRAEMAHVLALALPGELFEDVNQAAVDAALASGQYMQDVTAGTPFREDILRLYAWGVTGGADERGSFLPEENVSRCEAAAMAARLVYGDLRQRLEWEILPPYSRKGTTMADLVKSDGRFYAAPDPDDMEKIAADVRYMLSRGERTVSLQYEPGVVNSRFVDRLLTSFLAAVREHVEQTYNNVTAPYSPRSGTVVITFSSSLYDDSLTERYREQTMEYALAVHDRMWEEGLITEDMSEYEKARVYFAWICENCRYDIKDNAMSHSGYRVFDEGIAVCDGYTAAYNLLLKLEDISCGTWSTANHIWTVAELDGQAYHIDPTWGDQEYGVEYRFFAMTKTDALARFKESAA